MYCDTQPLWKTVWGFFKKLGIKPPYDPAIPLQGIYPKETKIEKDTCTPMFIAALFAIARTWKQSRCPLTEVVVHIYNGIKAIKANTFKFILMR